MITPKVRAMAAALLLAAAGAQVAGAADFAVERRRMTQEIEALARQTGAETGRPAFDARVMTAMDTVPRHEFVPAEQIDVAYANRPVPIGHGQTISQPYIVALMTDLAKAQPGHKVLEVGTGSGYQAAVMAQLAREVYSIEIVEPLGQQAKRRLGQLGYGNVQVRLGDGYHGWEEHAPFDAILVTAAASHIPPPLIRQLKPGGRMVIPVGAAFMVQQLMLIEKKPDGTVSTRQILPVAFVPLTGGR
ncbi:protein-L-isoaspartate(D-aspartate) O-methyltransferase [Variovorax ginsengisoli]|uniref:Protein-L-isoaspartate O-methyltransferase n=1 Tax=Variovorax ginsengisoli TaxID=363844 RepID=A0ABT8S8L3_9BURK|nr:protein-L-isoaspartate(D-aspartate) O-methyltransferase [Variovorax ginsengisoli]MDN8616073.1 protein-L-isoaspartate(D-aspartate) O-methyltransferase [Variovorax ginsengisoli]MDO1535243.1 protein-L-isoaspartate(D-aspartate) O-methyltransferase [Variovorax ginsengisoli]